MEKCHPQIGEHLGPEGLRVGGHRLQVRTGLSLCPLAALTPVLRLFLHRGTDDIGLTPLPHQAADKIVHPLALVLMDHIGLHRRAARGQLVDDRHIQVPVYDERQRPRDGRGRHDQHMGGRHPALLRFASQGGPLGHPEAVLLVGHDQGQPPELYLGGDQGMGADDQIDFSGGQGLPGLPLLLLSQPPGEQANPDPGRTQKGGQRAPVLLRQHLSGGHQGGLTARSRGEPRGKGGHHRLA